MLSKIEETKVKDFFNIMVRLNEKTEMQESLLFIYSTYEGKDIEEWSFNSASKEDLKEKLNKLLSIVGENFLTQKLSYKEMESILHRLVSKTVSEKISTLVNYAGVNVNSDTEISPLSVVLLFNNSGMSEIKDILLNKINNENIKNNLFDNLIYENGEWISAVEILNRFTLDKNNTLGLRTLHEHFKSNMLYETKTTNNSWCFLNESYMIQNILSYIDLKLKENKSYIYYQESIFKNNIILENIKNHDFIYCERILNSFDSKEITQYLEEGSVYPNKKNRKILPKIQGLLNIGKENPLIMSILKEILLNNNEITNIINYAEENKSNYYSKEDKVREAMDNNYLLLFSSIKETYGKDNFLTLIKDINNLNNKNYENIVDLTKIPKNNRDDYLFLNLLSNLYKETVNLLLNNGYEPHYLEKNAIMKGRKYKSIINKDLLIIENKTTESIAIDKEIKILFGIINKSNLKNLDILLKTRKEECLKYFQESAAELDNKVHYFYIDNKIPPEIVSKCSPVTSAILSGNIDIVNILLENNIPLTERQTALLYIPLSITRKTVIDKEESENKILNFIKNENTTEELLTNFINGNIIPILKTNGKWTETTFNILNTLFDNNYLNMREKNKVILLDILGKDSAGGLLIYNKLKSEDKKILIEFSGTGNKDIFLNKALSSSINGVDIRGFLNSFFQEFKKVVLSEIDINSDKADFYLNMLKSKDKKINFKNIDLLDGCVAEIEKTLIDDTFKNVQMILKNKNRL